MIELNKSEKRAAKDLIRKGILHRHAQWQQELRELLRNRDIQVQPALLKFSKTKIWIDKPEAVPQNKLYYFLCMVRYFLQSVNPNTSFTKPLKALLSEYKPKISAMGFPQNWENEEIWR